MCVDLRFCVALCWMCAPVWPPAGLETQKRTHRHTQTVKTADILSSRAALANSITESIFFSLIASRWTPGALREKRGRLRVFFKYPRVLVQCVEFFSAWSTAVKLKIRVFGRMGKEGGRKQTTGTGLTRTSSQPNLAQSAPGGCIASEEECHHHT